VASGADVDELAALLLSADRKRPVVVISRFPNPRQASIDVATVEQRVADLADVYAVVTGPRTRRFEELMPAKTHVFGAAGRVYPPVLTWHADPYAAPLFMVRAAKDTKPKTRALITAALKASMLAEAAPGDRIPATVRSLDAPHRAEVETADGRTATVARELLFPNVPIDRLLTVGMPLDGVLRADRYDVSDMIVPVSDRAAGYRPGDLVLVEVQWVEDDRAVVRLCPAMDATVSRAQVTSNDLDRVRDLMSQGEVLRARLVRTDPDWHLTMLDVNDDETPVTAPALLRGGPPWLTLVAVEDLRTHAAAAGLDPGAAEEEEAELDDLETLASETLVPGEDGTLVDDELVEELVDDLEHQMARHAVTVDLADGPTSESSADRGLPAEPMVNEPGTEDSLAIERAAREATENRSRLLAQAVSNLRRENGQLTRNLDRTQTRLDDSREELTRVRVELRRARQASQRAKEQTTADSQWFLDPEEQLRFDVRLQWAKKIPAAGKQSHPLSEDAYTVGPDFLATLDNFPQDREKVVEVIVEVLTGIADASQGRQVHQLRTGSGPSDPLVVRSDGATCWRAYVQQKSPQARRLHYWRTVKGIELSRVVPHDVNTP
jgi:hypothetical protein